VKVTLTATFADEEAALEAAERVRERAGPRAGVRLLIPERPQQVIDASVVAVRSPWRWVGVFGFALGLVGAYVFLSMGAHWTLGLLSIATGVTGGVLLGAWLSGEEFAARVASTAELRRHAEPLRSGRSVVVARVKRSQGEAVWRLLEDFGGLVAESRPA
jgi:hypothetical protein